jgi:hypothetical protein
MRHLGDVSVVRLSGNATPKSYKESFVRLYKFSIGQYRGQDLYRLETWMKENLPGNAEGTPAIAVDYFGGGNIESLGTQAVPWNSKKGDPKDAGIEWLAVSVNTLSQAMAKEDPTFTRDDGNEYAFLRALNPSFEEGMRGIPSPDARAGTSIFIYHR